VRARNGKYSVNGILSDMPSSGIFRVASLRRSPESMKSGSASEPTRNIIFLQISSFSRAVLPFGQNQDQTRRRLSVPYRPQQAVGVPGVSRHIKQAAIEFLSAF
jgi:hypothetical protein